MEKFLLISLFFYVIQLQVISQAQYVNPNEIENVRFSTIVKPPASSQTLFLSGAGVRGLDINGTFVKFTAIGVYMENKGIPILAANWKGKNAEELNNSDQFFTDMVTGDFEKFTKVTMILPLTGPQYSEKVAENCVNIWKSRGVYNAVQAKAIDDFLNVFKPQTFPPSASILFSQFPRGAVAIAFSKDGSIPRVANAVIENKLLAEAILETIIGKNGVSPAARLSIAQRLEKLF
ncbi:chalcone--flavanone isomerase-like [Mercurialis annua]|uniref:chalcone--flavanone isomerase-like n=1 Tax=Mercurialis annua TaxID=3986 RepID=UPI00215F078A|nr:chalcone--flavanone isomerase-like [Mercurialis annua]